MSVLGFKKYIILIAGLMLVLTSAGSAYAYLKAEDVKPLNFKVKMSRDQFFAQSELVEEAPGNDQALKYRVRIPKGWIKLPAAETESVHLSTAIFKDLSTYLSQPKGDTRSRFRVRVLELKHFISAENWFLNYMLLNGSTIDGLLIKSERRLEAEYTVLDDGQPFVVRAVVEITGPRVVLAEYMVASQYAAEERDLQVWAMASFTLTNPDTGLIEPVEVYSFVDIVRFEYPQSWILYSPPVTTIDRMEASILNLKGVSRDDLKNINMNDTKLDGRVDVEVVSKTIGTSEAQEIEHLKKKLNQKGLETGELIKSINDIKLNKRIAHSKIDSYRIKSNDPKMARYELWVAILESEGRFYIITLITMGREENFSVWAQNTETFKHVLRSLAPVNDGE
jgi:hypothetical protein